MPEFSIASCALLGGIATVLIERLLTPRPGLRRPLSCWLLHSGIWLTLLAVLMTLTARPLFATVNSLVLWLLIVLVSNAKYHSLREAFVCADFEYFSDAVRFPRLYLPFFGIGKAIVMALAFVAYLWAGLWFEPAAAAGHWHGLITAALGVLLLVLGNRDRTPACFDANADLLRWGLAASLWRYFRAARQPVDRQALGSPFAEAPAKVPSALPDIVSVQSESFFDVRGLWAGVKPGVLGEFDHLGSQALARGKLQVAAWGANTVRTEFAFLTGIPADRLGVHRFNPYRVLARKGLPSIAGHMKALGYRTVCIHPYDGSFYGRNKVLPMLGFDTFIDVRAFDASQKAGPFIGDCAVADKIAELLDDPLRTQPLYIHAVTMENHGPLNLEQVTAQELPQWFDQPLTPAMQDLGPYLRHVANADRMLGKLRHTLQTQPREAVLCFFGDHVPILPEVYQAVGAPDGDTDYLIWHNRRQGCGTATDVAVQDLSRLLVGHALSTATHPATASAQ